MVTFSNAYWSGTTATAADVDTTYGFTTTDADSGTNTLDDSTATIANLVGVPVANLNAYNAVGRSLNTSIFQSGVLKDDGIVAADAFGVLAYGVAVVPDQYAFENTTIADYELIVPVNSSGVAGTQTFYFFMDVE